MSLSCPACGSTSVSSPVESAADPVLGREYSWRDCACGAQFACPLQEPGADWYEAAVSEEVLRPPEEDPRFRLFFEEAPPESGLLDLGCGDGGFLALAAQRGYAPCFGLDHDERRAAAARARGLAVSTGDWPALLRSRAPGSLKVVTLFDVLEHLAAPRALLGEIRRVLAPGGRLVITVPNALRPRPFGREDFDKAPHHLTRWTPSALAGLLEREGFRVARMDAARPDLALTRELMALHWAVKPALGAARRILFGSRSDASAGITRLYEREGGRGPLAHKGLRRVLFDAFKLAASAAALPPAAALCAWWRTTRRDAGASLYASARRIS